MKAGRCFVLTVAVLVLFTVARSSGLLGPAVLSVSLLTAALALIAWSAGAALADLGLRRADVRAGLLYGAAACGVVLLALVMAAVIPATNGFLHDSRAQIGGGRLLYELGVPGVTAREGLPKRQPRTAARLRPDRRPATSGCSPGDGPAGGPGVSSATATSSSTIGRRLSGATTQVTATGTVLA